MRPSNSAFLRAVRAFLQSPQHKSKINFPVAFDPEQEASSVYSATEAPVQYILNKKNRVVYKHRGTLTQEEIEKIRKLVLNKDYESVRPSCPLFVIASPKGAATFTARHFKLRSLDCVPAKVAAGLRPWQ